MKTKLQSIRLDADTFAIVEKYQKILQTGSVNETIVRLIHAADGKEFVTIVPASTEIAHYKELSYFAGQLQKTKLLWNEIKSRLKLHRPLDPSDTDGVKEWTNNQIKIFRFFDECELLQRHYHALAALLSKTSIAELQQLQRAAVLVKEWAKDSQNYANKSKSPEEKRTYLEDKKSFEIVHETLTHLGVVTHI